MFAHVLMFVFRYFFEFVGQGEQRLQRVPPALPLAHARHAPQRRGPPQARLGRRGAAVSGGAGPGGG